MKESTFWTTCVKPMLRRMLVYRLENTVARGMPDVHVAFAGRQTWLELKVMKGQRIEVRYSQFKWLYKRLEQRLHDTYYVALHRDEIWIWRGQRIWEQQHLMGPEDSRETDDSIVFVPPPPDLTMKVGASGDAFRAFIFAH